MACEIDPIDGSISAVGVVDASRTHEGSAMKAELIHDRPDVGGKPAGAVRLKRAYEPPEGADGYRVLVDRLWPRGIRKDALAIDTWMKDIGPSDELRRWFGHDASRWEEFASRYREELGRPSAAELVDDLVARATHGAITLVYGAKDQVHNQAVVIRSVIEQRLRRARTRARPSSPRRRRPDYPRRGTRRREAMGGAG